MNVESNFNRVVHELQSGNFKSIDVSTNVLHAISRKEFQTMRSVYQKNRRQRFKPVFLLAFCISLITTVAAGTAFITPNNWNGITLSQSNLKGKHISPNSSISTRERMQQWLERPGTIKQIYQLSEIKSKLTYLTASQTPVPMERRVAGLINLNIGNPDNTKHTPAVVDFYLKEGQWAVVIQSSDPTTSQAIQKISTLSQRYEGDWEMLKNNDNCLAMYIDDGNEKLIDLKVIQQDKQVMGMQISGNLSKEQMNELMNSYLVN